jgi:hypothetical protein
VVARLVPASCTTELLLKLVPVTVRVKAGLPATTALGDKVASVGSGLGSSTVKGVVLVAVPPGVVTLSRPDVTLGGTTNVSVVAFTTVKLTGSPLRVTAVVFVRSVPITVTVVPTSPLAGLKLIRIGAGVVIVNGTGAEVPPPGSGFVTNTSKLPAVPRALVGSVAVSCVAET